jgi:S-adenosylmethionine-dependent methyltransferase
MASKKKQQQREAMLARQSDTLFDGIANKFDENIYGTSKGQLRHRLLLHYLQPYIHSDSSLRVLDAGGGTGMMSMAFCEQGHKVTLYDGSSEVLEIAKQRLAPFIHTSESKFDTAIQSNQKGNEQVSGSATIIQADINELALDERSDVVLCHAVLEWLQHPKKTISRLLSMVEDGGVLSLSFFNRDAALFNNAIWGNFEYIDNGLKVKNQVRLNPHNAQVPADIISYIQQNHSDVEIVHQAGIRCFHDYMADKDKQVEEFDRILQLEKKYGRKVPYKWLGKYFHLIIRKQLQS